MLLSNFKKLFIDGVELKQLFINGIQVWKSGPKNWVKYSTEADGVTIYNGGLGYKEGYRIRSGGAEQSSTNAGTKALCTGFIPFKKGDVLRMSPPFSGLNISNAINFSDGSFANIGQRTSSGVRYGICASGTGWDTSISTVNRITVVDISSVSNADAVRYVRITYPWDDNAIADENQVKSGEDFIVTVNEEIE